MKKDKCLKKVKLHKMLRPEVLLELNDNLSELVHATSPHCGDHGDHQWGMHGHGPGRHGPWGRHERGPQGPWGPHERGPQGPWGPIERGHHGPWGHHGSRRRGSWSCHGSYPTGRRECRRMCGRRKTLLNAEDDGDFAVKVDVNNFKFSDLSVKVIDDSVVIEGQHDEREDEDGFVTRHFKKRSLIPEGYDSEKVSSTLSTDGVLTVRIPKIKKEVKERAVDIVELPDSDSEDDVEVLITEKMSEMET